MKLEMFSGGAAGPVASFALTPEIRRGVRYRIGRTINDADIQRVLVEDVRAILDQYARLGAWVERIDAVKPRDPSWANLRHDPPALSGIPVNNPDPSERARRSAAMKAVWAKKRAQGERVPKQPRPTTRALGVRGRACSAAQRETMSQAQRAAWARRKALASAK